MTGTVTQNVDDFHTITPHLIVRDAPRAIEFYTRAFGAAELYRNLAPDGKSVMHAELMLGNSRFLLHDEFPEQSCSRRWPMRGPASHCTFMSTMSTPCSVRLSTPAPRCSCRWKTASGATATASSRTRSGTAGRSRPV
jgi:uncharacterized glyoxalase superfamily protein PhnB